MHITSLNSSAKTEETILGRQLREALNLEEQRQANAPRGSDDRDPARDAILVGGDEPEDESFRHTVHQQLALGRDLERTLLGLHDPGPACTANAVVVAVQDDRTDDTPFRIQAAIGAWHTEARLFHHHRQPIRVTNGRDVAEPMHAIRIHVADDGIHPRCACALQDVRPLRTRELGPCGERLSHLESLDCLNEQFLRFRHDTTGSLHAALLSANSPRLVAKFNDFW